MPILTVHTAPLLLLCSLPMVMAIVHCSFDLLLTRLHIKVGVLATDAPPPQRQLCMCSAQQRAHRRQLVGCRRVQLSRFTPCPLQAATKQVRRIFADESEPANTGGRSSGAELRGWVGSGWRHRLCLAVESEGPGAASGGPWAGSSSCRRQLLPTATVY